MRILTQAQIYPTSHDKVCVGGARQDRSRHDVEVGAPMGKTETERSAGPNLVTWDGDDDPKNPKNWAFRKKWAAITIVSFFTLISLSR